MVIFIISIIGFKEMEDTIVSNKWTVWIGKNVLSENQVKKYRDQGLNITVFSTDFNEAKTEVIEEALYTIQEHHPSERLLVERKIKIS
jgi:hypothetical protein